jgi:hypothetical protein
MDTLGGEDKADIVNHDGSQNRNMTVINEAGFPADGAGGIGKMIYENRTSVVVLVIASRSLVWYRCG